jgi:hypothetical protein
MWKVFPLIIYLRVNKPTYVGLMQEDRWDSEAVWTLEKRYLYSSCRELNPDSPAVHLFA